MSLVFEAVVNEVLLPEVSAKRLMSESRMSLGMLLNFEANVALSIDDNARSFFMTERMQEM